MNQGYDDFFKKARQAKQGSGKSSPPKFEMQSKPETSEEALRKMLKIKESRPKARFPWRGLMVTAALSSLLGWWSVDPELPEKIMSKIEIQIVGHAGAEGQSGEEKAAATKAKAAEKPASDATKAGVQEVKAAAAPVGEDSSHLAKLRERSQALDEREKELNQMEEELQKEKEEIEARIKQLEDLRAQITSVLKERVEVDQEKVMKLVETYSNMKPKQAAEILAGIDEDLAVEVLGKMKKKNAAEIMNLLESGKARSISEKYAGYRRR